MNIVQELEKRKRLLKILHSPSNSEVYTPAELVEKMLDKLPKEIWKNPDLKWVDPCAKSGIFILEVIIRLMKNLDIRDETLRNNDETLLYNHIINNMVTAYVNEERNKWVVSKMIYGDTSEVERVKLLEINKIKEDMPKFDVVVGNPPYQGTGRKKLYINFIEKSFRILTPKGLLMFITPKLGLSFLCGQNISQKRLSRLKQLELINVNDNIKQHFKGIGSDFCYFIAKNEDVKYSTVLLDKNGNKNKLMISNKTVISFSGNIIETSILTKTINNKNEFKRTAARTTEFVKNGKYKVLYKILTNNEEIKYTNILHKDHKKIKILWPTVGKRFIYDKNGELMPGTSFVVYIPFENFENFKLFISSKLFKFLENSFSGMRSPFDYIIKSIKKPTISSKWTNKKLYKFYNLTQEEIDYIESQVK